MSALEFSVSGMEADVYGASPAIVARIHLRETTGALVHTIALRCQVRIEPQRRAYGADIEGLGDLFGTRRRWSETLKPFLWAHTATMVPGFNGETEVALSIPCTYDFEVAATKYLHAVRDGDIPLALMFSGTMFTRGTTGFQVEQIPWNSDIECLMPTQVWRDTMDAFFPGGGWIRASVATIDALDRFRTDRGFTSWEETLTVLLGDGMAPRALEETRP